MTVKALATMMPPPNPWMARLMISWAMDRLRPQAHDALKKMIRPAM